MAPYSQTFSFLPDSMKKIVEMIVKTLDPDEVLLFGSRARGDHRENSDFDLAIKASKLSSHAWTKVLLAIDEEPLTLYKVDLVHFEQMSVDYQTRISSEGKSLYVR